MEHAQRGCKPFSKAKSRASCSYTFILPRQQYEDVSVLTMRSIRVLQSARGHDTIFDVANNDQRRHVAALGSTTPEASARERL